MEALFQPNEAESGVMIDWFRCVQGLGAEEVQVETSTRGFELACCLQDWPEAFTQAVVVLKAAKEEEFWYMVGLISLGMGWVKPKGGIMRIMQVLMVAGSAAMGELDWVCQGGVQGMLCGLPNCSCQSLPA